MIDKDLYTKWPQDVLTKDTIFCENKRFQMLNDSSLLEINKLEDCHV